MKRPRALLLLLPLLTACGGSSTQVPKALVTEYRQAGGPPTFAQLVRRATPARRVPLVYFYADWCGPCRRFRAALPSAPVDEALQRAALLKVNVDSFPDLATHYRVTAVPTSVKVDAQDRPLASITSDRWAADVLAEIAPVMAKLVNSTAYDLEQ